MNTSPWHTRWSGEVMPPPISANRSGPTEAKVARSSRLAAR